MSKIHKQVSDDWRLFLSEQEVKVKSSIDTEAKMAAIKQQLADVITSLSGLVDKHRNLKPTLDQINSIADILDKANLDEPESEAAE